MNDSNICLILSTVFVVVEVRQMRKEMQNLMKQTFLSFIIYAHVCSVAYISYLIVDVG